MSVVTESPIEIGPLRLKRRGAPGRTRLDIPGLRGSAAACATLTEKLESLSGIREVQANPLTGTALIHYDAASWTPDDLLQEAAASLGVPSLAPDIYDESSAGSSAPIRSAPRPGQVRLTVAGLRRAPERERAIELHLKQVRGVQVARANAWTGNVLVLFDPSVCSVEILTQACNELGVVEAPRRHWLQPKAKAQPAPIESEREPETQWHALSSSLVQRALATDVESGLDSNEVQARRASYGPNRMPDADEPSIAQLLYDQMANAPTMLLIAGAGISVATGGLIEAALILAVIGINSAVGAGTERTGHRAIAALQASTPMRTRVRRAGAETVIDSDELVPGDIIQLLPGDPIPADARVIEAHRLSVEESALTGESRSIDKQVEPVPASVPLADQLSMLHRGTTVVGGRGSAVIVATGPRTTIGQLQLLAASSEAPPTPMERDLDQMGRWLASGAAAICGAVFGLGMLRGVTLLQSAEVAVSLGVAAIPEGLTALATSVLALASGRMRQRGTLIRTLGAAEALGSVTVVCADKTGTLTENRMAAREIWSGGRVIRVGGAALAAAGEFTYDMRHWHRHRTPC